MKWFEAFFCYFLYQRLCFQFFAFLLNADFFFLFIILTRGLSNLIYFIYICGNDFEMVREDCIFQKLLNKLDWIQRYKPRAPDDTLQTAGFSPHAFVLFTITPSTPMNIADLNMLPKFCGSVIWSRNMKNLP